MNRSDVVYGLEGAEYYFRRMTEICPKEHKRCYGTKEQAIKEAINLLKEQKKIIEQYHKADGFLVVHGWKWEGK